MKSVRMVCVSFSPAEPVRSYSPCIVPGRPHLEQNAQHAADSLSRSNTPGAAHSMSANTPKIGMYMAMTMEPTIAPMTTIMRGSMRLVSCSVVDSTSSS